MRTADEDTWEQEYWDDILDEFGPEGYIEMRYGKAGATWTAEVGQQERQEQEELVSAA